MKKYLVLFLASFLLFSCTNKSEEKKLSEIAKKCESITVWTSFEDLKKANWEPIELDESQWEVYYYWDIWNEICRIVIKDSKVSEKEYSKVNL